MLAAMGYITPEQLAGRVTPVVFLSVCLEGLRQGWAEEREKSVGRDSFVLARPVA